MLKKKFLVLTSFLRPFRKSNQLFKWLVFAGFSSSSLVFAQNPGAGFIKVYISSGDARPIVPGSLATSHATLNQLFSDFGVTEFTKVDYKGVKPGEKLDKLYSISLTGNADSLSKVLNSTGLFSEIFYFEDALVN